MMSPRGSSPKDRPIAKDKDFRLQMVTFKDDKADEYETELVGHSEQILGEIQPTMLGHA